MRGPKERAHQGALQNANNPTRRQHNNNMEPQQSRERTAAVLSFFARLDRQRAKAARE